MLGSWAGAMGATQWMPEVWLHVGVDYDGDGKISPFGPPDDALATTARYFVERGGYRRGEHWGYEVRAPRKTAGGSRSYAEWQKRGVTRADGAGLSAAGSQGPAVGAGAGRPRFPAGPNFYAAKSYNPSMNYALALVHLGDLCAGGAPFVQKFPGSEPRPDAGRNRGNPAPVDRARLRYRRRRRPRRQRTTLAVRDYQRKVGLEPADGYAGVRLLARLRQGS